MGVMSEEGFDVELWLPSWRPWFSLYNRMLLPGKGGGDEEDPNADVPFLQVLPDDVLQRVLGMLPPHAVATCACVCRHLRRLAMAEHSWRGACLAVWGSRASAFREDYSETLRALSRHHRGSWHAMFLDRLRLRFEGVYVSRNHYLKPGVTNSRGAREVVLACFFRVIRFFPDGKCIVRTTASPPERVWRTLKFDGRGGAAHAEATVGRWRMAGPRVAVKMEYEGTGTEVRWSTRLRSTTRGAMNRLDVDAIVLYDRFAETNTALDAGAPGLALDPEEVDSEAARKVNARTSAFCFIPFERLDTHMINLPVSEMDLWLPG